MTTRNFAYFAVEDRRVQMIGTAGVAVLRYGLVFLLLLYGSFKFFTFEAEAIQPIVAWLYPLFGLMGTSALFGVFEIE